MMLRAEQCDVYDILDNNCTVGVSECAAFALIGSCVGAGHIESYYVARDEYERKISEFFGFSMPTDRS